MSVSRVVPALLVRNGLGLPDVLVDVGVFSSGGGVGPRSYQSISSVSQWAKFVQFIPYPGGEWSQEDVGVPYPF